MELRGQEEDSEGDDFLPNHRRLDHLGHLYAEPELPDSAPNPLPSAFRRPLLFPSPLSSSPAPPPAGPSADPPPRPPPTAAARYRECQKNHAARAGGHVLDGCGEFMPGGDEGTAEALKCAACGCHRSFHRKEPDGGADGDALFLPASAPRYFIPPAPFALQTPFAAAARQKRGGEEENNYSGGTTTTESSSEEMRQQMAAGAARKRHRTKFTAGQKEMMAEFAERVGWRMQKQDEGAVERFCREAGVSRQVFKVWMHNNKQHAGKGRPRGAREESPAARQQAAEGEEQGLRLPQKPSSSSS